MYSIDKQRFGRFLATLRKEQGMTQKELAEKLYVSDKAISKWETGVSMPDVALLTPLAELLNVTVTELLSGQRLPEKALDTQQVEELMQQAITLGQTPSVPRRKRLVQYLLSLLLGAAQLLLLPLLGVPRQQLPAEHVLTIMGLGAIFGLYFFLFAPQRLPAYFDENKISSFSNGPVRLNLSGLVYFNNRNFPHILRVCRLWCAVATGASPLLYLLLSTALSALWSQYATQIWLVLVLGGLFLPIVIVGRKYE